MQHIINFLVRNKNFVVFSLLFALAIFLTIQTHSYHRSKFINSANFVSGSLYSVTESVSGYFGLRKKNQTLLQENKRLRSYISELNIPAKNEKIDTVSFNSPFRFYTATVIKNSYSLNHNFLTINTGQKDGVQVDFGVISSKGIVGIVDHTSRNYANVISILNTSNRISAQLKKTNHFGTLAWDGKDPRFTMLIDIPKAAPVQKGDTIVTSGRSSIFPKGVLIGKISDFKLDLSENYYEIKVELFNDMTNMGYVYVIENLHKKEIDSLLNK